MTLTSSLFNTSDNLILVAVMLVSYFLEYAISKDLAIARPGPKGGL